MKKIAIAGLAVLLVFALVALVGCGGGAGTDNGTTNGTTTPPSDGGTDDGTGNGAVSGTSVEIKDFAFTPKNLEVAVGDTVTWTNNDSEPHTVSGDGGISSSTLNTGDTYEMTFDTAGSFSYICGIHPAMTGTVVVK